jgi:UDP-N-acetylmuramate--alanine ligase
MSEAAWAARVSSPARVHFIGIGGVGMAGLARLLMQAGFTVSGSDTASHRLTELLADEGAAVFRGHSARNVPESVDWAVRTPAVGEDNPELQTLRGRQVPVFARGEVLAALSRSRRTIAVAGAHGKTTTAAMLTHLLRGAGLNCGYAIGGETAFPGVVADRGVSDWFVCEADESDGTLVHYAPAVGVLTHVEWDHVERFGSEAALLDCYRRFVSRCGMVILRGGDAMARRVTERHPRVMILREDSVRMQTVDDPSGQWVQAVLDGEAVSFRLPLPGIHNAWNAVMALAAARQTGRDWQTLVQAFRGFASVGRRFERVRAGGIELVHDYAHHPTEIRAVLCSARALRPKRLVVAFQPHRFSRTRHLLTEFAEAFRGVDALHLLPVYAASEARELGVDSDALRTACAAELREERVQMHGSAEALIESVRKGLAIGDVFLIVGAGDIQEVFVRMRAELEEPGNL